jgi:hypothetical protein
MKRGKKRCWKGCRPVPGKKPYSAGSCTCSMSALRPGMIELMNPDAMDSRAYGAGVGGFLAGPPGTVGGLAAGQVIGRNKKKKLSNRDRAMILGSLAGPVGVGAAHILVPEHRYAALQPGMIEFADSRPRNDMGQYMANETGGADPNSMAAAYGNVEQEKIIRRRSLVQRMKAMMGRNDQQPVM